MRPEVARIICAVVLAISASMITATQGTQQVALSQQTHQVFELGTGSPLHVFTLTVGTSRVLTLDVTSKVSAVNVEILTPSGAPIDPALRGCQTSAPVPRRQRVSRRWGRSP